MRGQNFHGPSGSSNLGFLLPVASRQTPFGRVTLFEHSESIAHAFESNNQNLESEYRKLFQIILIWIDVSARSFDLSWR
ncbi:protein of unknown function [Nitratireductor aquimarinus]